MQFWNQDRWQLVHIVGIMMAFAVEIAVGIGYGYLYTYLGLPTCSGLACPKHFWQEPYVAFLIGVVVGAIVGCLTIHISAPRTFTVKTWLKCTVSISIFLPLANIVSFLMFGAVWITLQELTDSFRYAWKNAADDVIMFLLFLAFFILIPGITLGLFTARNGFRSQSAEKSQDD